jgi:hypothetical protein
LPPLPTQGGASALTMAEREAAGGAARPQPAAAGLSDASPGPAHSDDVMLDMAHAADSDEEVAAVLAAEAAEAHAAAQHAQQV